MHKMLRKKKLNIYNLLTLVLMLTATSAYGATLKVQGTIYDRGNGKPETPVMISYFGNDTTVVTTTTGTYEVTLQVPFMSGLLNVSALNCVNDTIKRDVFYSWGQKTVTADFDMCTQNYDVYVKGKVYFKDRPASFAKVEFSLNDFNTLLEFVYTDREGNFGIRLGTGPYKTGKFSARVNSCASGLYNGASATYSHGDTLNFSMIKCKMENKTLYTGQVKRGEQYTVKDEIKMLLYELKEDRTGMQLVDSTMTQQGGKYEFFITDQRSFLVKAEPQSVTGSVFPIYSNGSFFWDKGPAVHIKHLKGFEYQKVSMLFHERSAGYASIEGFVVNEHSEELSRKYPAVMLLDENGNPITFTYVDDLGYYRFDNLHEGSYQIWIDEPGRPTIPAIIYVDESQPIFSAPDMVADNLGIHPRGALQVENVVSQNEMTVYPNPFNDRIFFDVNEEHIQSVELYSTAGEVIKQFDDLSVASIDVPSLDAGLYLLKITTDRSSYFKQMVKR